MPVRQDRAPMSATTDAGRVIAAHGRRGLIETSGGTQPYIVKGRRLKVACGDRVRAEQRPGSEELLVTTVEPRDNELARQPPHGRPPEVIAANLSQLIAVCAPRPEPDLFLLDRYFCAAEIMGCRSVLLWNKCDLGPAPQALSASYRDVGCSMLEVCARDYRTLEPLRAVLRGHTSVLVGQSGVGKSSLVNALVPGTAAAVSALSTGNDMGTHTTTAVVMYAVGGDGRLVDAPGVRDFLPAWAQGQRVDRGFRDICLTAQGCRFADCRHDHEPDCAVKAAVAAGRIARRRYQSYLQLLESVHRARRP